MNKRKYQDAIGRLLGENARKFRPVQEEAQQSMVKRATVLPVPVIVMILSQVTGAREIATLLRSITVTLRIAKVKATQSGNRAEAERIAEQREILWKRIAFEYFPKLIEPGLAEIYNQNGYADQTSALEEIIPALVLVPDSLEVVVDASGYQAEWIGKLKAEEKDQIKLKDYRRAFVIGRKSKFTHFNMQLVEKMVEEVNPFYDRRKLQDVDVFSFNDRRRFQEHVPVFVEVSESIGFLRDIRGLGVNYPQEQDLDTDMSMSECEDIHFFDKEKGAWCFLNFVSVYSEFFNNVTEEEVAQMFLNGKTSDSDLLELFERTDFDYSMKVEVDLSKAVVEQAILIAKDHESRAEGCKIVSQY